ncbi:MAG: hypothetical protein M1819_005990 [Sarea resinae]|nr:MAG: hypothetical protein M1819_005990 [Sarea resinae]
MAAPRTVSTRALSRVAAPRSHQVRSLHITGSTSTPSPWVTSTRGASYRPQSLSELKSECSKRSINAGGSKEQLVNRLITDDLARARGFSTAVKQASKRPIPIVAQPHPNPSRPFNTSRALKAVHDTSTMDFAYMPSMEAAGALDDAVRVPLLPDNFFPQRDTGKNISTEAEPDAPVPRAVIFTTSADSTHISSPSAMTDVVDNGAITMDPFSLAEKVSLAAASQLSGATLSAEQAKQPGAIKQVWSGFLDDLLGAKKTAGRA